MTVLRCPHRLGFRAKLPPTHLSQRLPVHSFRPCCASPSLVSPLRFRSVLALTRACVDACGPRPWQRRQAPIRIHAAARSRRQSAHRSLPLLLHRGHRSSSPLSSHSHAARQSVATPGSDRAPSLAACRRLLQRHRRRPCSEPHRRPSARPASARLRLRMLHLLRRRLSLMEQPRLR